MNFTARSIGNNQAPSGSQSTRLAFIDNLRVFLTILVVAHHAAQPYGPTGGRWLIFNAERAEILAAFFSTNAAFFMGLFFLISGYFLPSVYDRKGAAIFLKDRLLRLGIPILFFVLLVFPLMLYAFGDRQLPLSQYFMQTYLRPEQLEFGHLWFLTHLLVYAMGYWIWREWMSGRIIRSSGSPAQLFRLRDRMIWLYVIGLAIATFVVRVQYPIDTWIRVLGLIPVEVAHLPQYLSLFLIGAMADRGRWLLQLPQQQGLKWLGIGLGATLLRYLYTLGGHRMFPAPMIAGGGWSGQSALWSGWEAIICVGLSIGLLVFFRDYINHSGRWHRFLSTNAYAVYLIHLPIVVGMQLGVAAVAIAPLAKFLLVTLVSLPLCWGASDLLRRLPGVGSIL